MVDHSVWNRDVVGSNPTVPTNFGAITQSGMSSCFASRMSLVQIQLAPPIIAD